MIKNSIKYTIALGALLLPWAIGAQTVNQGELYITPGTQFSTVGNLQNTPSGTLINDGDAYIYANFNNDGVVDHLGEQGNTRFIGRNVQQLSGGNTSYFYNVVFDNDASSTASFELSNEMSIAGNADFNEGIVNNDNFGGLMVFEDNATHSNVYNGSHVDGTVEKRGDDDFKFPIGDSQYYRFAGISAPDNNADAISAKYFFENPDAAYPLANKTGVLELIDNQEYWAIFNQSGSSEIVLTLSWSSATTPESIIADPLQDALRIVRWDDVQNLWVDEGGIVNVDEKTVTTPLKVDGYGIFTLGRVKGGIVLPGDVVVYNGVTPNGDGLNDYLIIDNINNLANNRVEVFNRWGVKVFDTTNYDTSGNVFNGFSEGRMTVGSEHLLPTGTYFYVLSYDFSDGTGTQRIKKAGYLYLNGD